MTVEYDFTDHASHLDHLVDDDHHHRTTPPSVDDHDDDVPNDPPTAVNDAATVTRTLRRQAIEVLANDTDPDGGPITIDSATDPANGTWSSRGR